MSYLFLVVVGFFLLLLLILNFSVSLGRRYGRLQLEKHAGHKLEVVGVAESAVLGLLGLLIAFTFSGAYDRYENRKLHIIEEANVFDAAYEYVDLVLPQRQAALRQDIRQYLDLHLASYQDLPNLTKVRRDLDQAILVQHKIWQTVIEDSKENPNQSMVQLVLPAMEEMFKTAHAGINLAKIHPPGIIFILLIGLASLGGFLVGYNAAETRQKHPIHIISYVLLTAFTIYVIINLELPRVGIIRFNSFDQMLMDVREDMKAVY